MKFEKKEQEEIQEITGYSVDLGFSIMCNEKRVGHIFLNELLTGDYFIEDITRKRFRLQQINTAR